MHPPSSFCTPRSRRLETFGTKGQCASSAHWAIHRACRKLSSVHRLPLPNLVVDALGIVDALGVKKFHVIGHDWGGAVAWGLASFAADRVLSLTSVSVPAPGAMGHELADESSCQYKTV